MAGKPAQAAKKAPTPKAPAAPARRRVVDDDDPKPVAKAETPPAADPTPPVADPEPATQPVVGDGVIDTPEEAAKAAKDRVIVRVPRTFRLRLTSHQVITYPEGAYAMDKEHAEHWFSKANGVTIVEA